MHTMKGTAYPPLAERRTHNVDDYCAPRGHTSLAP
jgi:hypothetical protein